MLYLLSFSVFSVYRRISPSRRVSVLLCHLASHSHRLPPCVWVLRAGASAVVTALLALTCRALPSWVPLPLLQPQLSPYRTLTCTWVLVPQVVGGLLLSVFFNQKV